MEDIIDIIVTETTNTIEITSQATDEIIDVNIIDNREDITLNVTPSLVEININSLTGNFGVEWGDITGTLADQTDLNTALGLKADLVGGKVPSSQLPSYVDDIVEVANYAALPATGETGKIYVVLDTNKIYRWSGSAYIEIADSTAVWGAITGTLSSQTDLQSALNAKFDDPTGDTTQYIAGDGSLITFPVAGQAGTLVREVRNTTGATLTKGTIVYISGATGNKPTVSKAIATGDSTSAQTFGLCQADIPNNSNGYIVCVGDITGLDTSAISEGVQLYLSSTTAGTYTTTKQYAPAHLVYIGVVTRSHPTQGQIEVKIQNGYELDEIHDVAISSITNNQGLFYESSTSLWKNKSIATVLGYTPMPTITFNSPLFIGSGGDVTIPLATASANGYLSFTDWNTFNGKQAALFGTGFVKISGTTISYDNSTYALDSAVVKLAGTQTITGDKAFTAAPTFDSGAGFKNPSGLYNYITATDTGWKMPVNFNKEHIFVLSTSTAYTYTFPSATGTLALTSDLSSYLPLSGGTLTGALSGTQATFTATANTYAGGALILKQFGGTNPIYLTSAGGYFAVSNGGSADHLLINSSGAATFSSSVTATQIITSVSSGTNQLILQTAGIDRGYIQASNASLLLNSITGNDIQFQGNGSTKMIITSAGNVGIGTTSPAVKLTVSGGSIQNVISGTGSSHIQLVNSSGSTYFGNDATGGYLYTDWNSPFLFYTNSAERMRITSGGRLLVGTTDAGTDFTRISTATASANVIGLVSTDDSSGAGFLVCRNSATTFIGGISRVGTTNAVAFNTTSDYRLKEDFKEIKGLEKLADIKVYDFKWKDNDARMDGVLAHELAEVLPYAVSGIKDGAEMQSVDYSKIVPIMVQAIKELKAELDTLKNK